MKKVLVLLALAGLCVATDSLFFEFTQFVAKYEKYYHTQEEFEYRFQAYKENKDRIAELNQANIKAGENLFTASISSLISLAMNSLNAS
jgi:cell shape-determining protein MreC